MSSSLSYSRKFIILKKELATVKRGNIKGHCKIERKGPKVMLTVNVENGDIESIYNVALFSDKKETPIITLGKLFTDEMGKGKEEYTLTERDLGASEYRTKGILIMTDKDILMGGYIEREDGSIERYIDDLALEPETVKEESPVEVEEAQIPEEEPYVEELQPVEAIPPEEVVFEEEYRLAEEVAFVEDTGPVEEAGPVEEIPPAEDLSPIEEEPPIEISSAEEVYEEEILVEEDKLEDEITIDETGPEEEIVDEQVVAEEFMYDFDDDSMEPDYKTLDYIKRLNQKNQTINYVLSILRFFPYAEPFKYNLKGYNWWLVDLDSANEYKAFLPYFAHVVGGNNKKYYDSPITTCAQLMNKYQHYLFGLYNEGEEVKYFLYGIPGTFTIDEHPYRGANGFNTWYEGVKAPGYWIIYIDPMTGKAVELPNPMIPIR